jgi:uncharacterized membrane protein
MNNKNTNIILLAIIVASFALGTFFYPQLPAKIASHWNSVGEVNGYMGKFWGTFLLPIIMLGIFAIYVAIPFLDPLKGNIQTFRKSYNAFWVLFETFFLYIYSMTIVWNLGYMFNFTTAIVPAIAVLFFFIGSFLKNVKRNWFVGIRTPWTLSSDEVWEKTHKLGGKLFQASALISLLALVVRGDIVIFIILVPVIVSAGIAVAYSYVEYKRVK